MALIEQEGSRRIRITVDGKTATREWVCDWSEKDTLGPRVGDMYPDETDPQLFVQDIDQQPEGHATGEEGYTKCRIIAQYTTRNPLKPQLSLDMATEGLEIAFGRVWNSDGTDVYEHVVTHHPRSELVVDRAYWFVPTGLMFGFLGRINLGPFCGCPMGTVLFTGATGRTEYTNLGETIWRMRLRFVYRPLGWNYIWRPDTATWDVPMPTIYSFADLSLLLI